MPPMMTQRLGQTPRGRRCQTKIAGDLPDQADCRFTRTLLGVRAKGDELEAIELRQQVGKGVHTIERPAYLSGSRPARR